MDRGKKERLIFISTLVGTTALCGLLLYEGCKNPETHEFRRPYYEGKYEPVQHTLQDNYKLS